MHTQREKTVVRPKSRHKGPEYQKAKKEYLDLKKQYIDTDPYPEPRLCYHPVKGYFTTIYFSEKYITDVQKAEVVHG